MSSHSISNDKKMERMMKLPFPKMTPQFDPVTQRARKKKVKNPASKRPLQY
jgi:hypothetical protein